jgi:hypothetical protein
LEVAVSVPLTVPSPSADGPEKPDMPSVLSYFAQRRAAGYIGFLLPPVVLIYDKYLTLGCLPGSISASYHTGAVFASRYNPGKSRRSLLRVLSRVKRLLFVIVAASSS